MLKNWLFNENDKTFLDGINGFIPKSIFDIHAHVYRKEDIDLEKFKVFDEGPVISDIGTWKRNLGKYMDENRLKGALFFPVPLFGPDKTNRANDFLVEQLYSNPEFKGLVAVSYRSSKEEMEKHVNNPQILGFKPYYTLGKGRLDINDDISDFLPEWVWDLADKNKLVIMLHILKKKALSDPTNQVEIKSKCRKYPNVRLILAHAGWGFDFRNTTDGLHVFRGIENIYFDTSCICEPAAFEAILTEFGPRKLLWGSDFPVSERRGKCVTLGDGFAWLQYDTAVWEKLSSTCNPTFFGIESLLAIKQAADNFGLNKDDLEDIFWNNAVKILNLEKNTNKKSLTQELHIHAKSVIPGRTRLLGKSPEIMAQEQWPVYFYKARGCEVWDLDGKHYYDMSTNGMGACLLGYADTDVFRAVRRRLNLGGMSSLNPPEEIELADLMCDIHPWAEQVRFTCSGGEAAAVAVRIARATTGRSIIAICGYHGWHDWYPVSNPGDYDSFQGHLSPGLQPEGVPAELRGAAVTFTYNNFGEFRQIIDDYGSKIAAVIMEPCRYNDSAPGFIELIKSCAEKSGFILIFDEITIGWRLATGGSHIKLGINPDIAVFAGAMGNGHPIGAVIGTKEAMNGADTSFISGTYRTESIGPAAASAAIMKMKKADVPAHINKAGRKVMECWMEYGKKYDLPVAVHDGYPCLAHFKFEHAESNALKTLYTQLMLERGFLGDTLFYPTLAHDDYVISLYKQAIDEVFDEISLIIKSGDINKYLKAPVCLY